MKLYILCGIDLYHLTAERFLEDNVCYWWLVLHRLRSVKHESTLSLLVYPKVGMHGRITSRPFTLMYDIRSIRKEFDSSLVVQYI